MPTYANPEKLIQRCEVSLAMPFMGRASGLNPRQLQVLVDSGHLRRLFREVYVGADTPDTLGLRARAVAMVLAPGAVVTDVTAAWLHGIDLLPARDLDQVPDVHAFHTGKGGFVARSGVTSGQRMMPDSDITELEGVPVTTLLRTACDLGRLLWRERAFAALDAFLHAGVDKDDLLLSVERFRGMRGVCQLRAFAPLADGRADSPPESIMRLRWLDTGLPAPEPQVPVDGPGTTWFLDLGLEGLYYAMEYDGEEFHSRECDVEHDRERREWMRDNTPWVIEVIDKHTLFNGTNTYEHKLRRGITEARRTVANRVRGRRWFIMPGE